VPWIYLSLIFYLGWRLTAPLRASIHTALGQRTFLSLALCCVPLAWCVGYTLCLSILWIVMQGLAVSIPLSPSLVWCAWIVLGFLLLLSLVIGKHPTGHLNVSGRAELSWAEVLLVSVIWVMAFGLTFGITALGPEEVSLPQNLSFDHSSHVALIRSFSAGYNFPTEYPFFAGRPIQYHFLFYFGGGTLEALGAPLSIALNLPSALALGSFLSLVSFCAWRISNSLWAAGIGIVLCLFRSSLSWVDWLSATLGSGHQLPAAPRTPFVFGVTPYEIWGIYSPQVYLNQRHLPYGFAWMLLALIACLWTPPLSAGQRDRSRWSYGFLGLLLGLGAYWNGSALIATLLALSPLTLYKRYRGKVLLIILPALASGVIITSLVTHGALHSTPFHPTVRFGFLLDSRAPLDVLIYFLWLFGILPLFALIAGRRRGQEGMLFWFGGAILVAFIFSCQISESAPQGHKFINAGTIMWSIVSAALVAALLTSWKRWKRLSGQFIFLILTLSGVIDACSLFRLARKTHSYHLSSPAARWIAQNTPRNSVFLSASRGEQPPLVAGRRVFIGPKALVSGAGYPYEERVLWLKEVATLDHAKQVEELQREGISYVATDVCELVTGLDGETCRTLPEVDVLASNPLLKKVYEDSSTQILTVPVPESR